MGILAPRPLRIYPWLGMLIRALLLQRGLFTFSLLLPHRCHSGACLMLDALQPSQTHLRARRLARIHSSLQLFSTALTTHASRAHPARAVLHRIAGILMEGGGSCAPRWLADGRAPTFAREITVCLQRYSRGPSLHRAMSIYVMASRKRRARHAEPRADRRRGLR